ncbi:MAG: Na(+)-translocating NADH-quinone reductase subunit C [Pirellulaceae bacterium]
MPPRDSMANTILVALVLCLVCSSLVSIAAVALKPMQEVNKALDVQKNILDATGLARDVLGVRASDLSKEQVETLFARIETKLVDIESGEFVDAPDDEVQTYDPRKAARNPKESTVVGETEYPIGLARREKIAKAYLVKGDDGSLEQIVLPVYGNGLWSTLYGFLALENDLVTIKGITFYEHAETPGLGGEVDNPDWKKQWEGLKIYGDDGLPAAGVAKGPAPLNNNYLVDGLSGATITSRGVTNLMQYWVSEDGFGPFLKKLKTHFPSAGGKS